MDQVAHWSLEDQVAAWAGAAASPTAAAAAATRPSRTVRGFLRRLMRMGDSVSCAVTTPTAGILSKRFDCGVKQFAAVIGGLADTMTVELSKRNESDRKIFFHPPYAVGDFAPEASARNPRAGQASRVVVKISRWATNHS